MYETSLQDGCEIPECCRAVSPHVALLCAHFQMEMIVNVLFFFPKHSPFLCDFFELSSSISVSKYLLPYVTFCAFSCRTFIFQKSILACVCFFFNRNIHGKTHILSAFQLLYFKYGFWTTCAPSFLECMCVLFSAVILIYVPICTSHQVHATD